MLVGIIHVREGGECGTMITNKWLKMIFLLEQYLNLKTQTFLFDRKNHIWKTTTTKQKSKKKEKYEVWSFQLEVNMISTIYLTILNLWGIQLNDFITN